MSKFIVGPAGLINTDYITTVTPYRKGEWLAHMHDGNQHVLTTEQVRQLCPLHDLVVDDLLRRWNADIARGL